MVDKIKLENIVEAGFDAEDGSAFLNIITEFVCSNCRHLVGQSSKYCTFCGESLNDTGKIEHYYKGEQLTDAQFKKELEQYEG